ncbi:MAG: preprotein translocase subunit SecE [Sphingopyxis sp.]
MAKFSPGKFVNEVKNEGRKIVWPTSRETMVTAIMVLIMTTLLALFFLGIDTLFGALVTWLLAFAA